MTTANAATTPASAGGTKRPPVSKRRVLRSLGEPKVAAMLLLGFSSGLPFFLSSNTLAYWLRDAGTALSAIGFLSWVGLAYSFKFLWAPIIDRVDAPLAGALGRRRGWMLVSQLLVGAGLLAMSIVGLSAGLVAIGSFALLVAFSSSTQDIVVDAWRIEVAADGDELGLLSSAYQLGYRVAILITEALILIIANHFGWQFSYGVMAALMGIGVVATFIAMEPRRAPADARSGAAAPLTTVRGMVDAIVSPFVEFFRAHGSLAVLMLAMISFYQLPDYISGPMYNPYYHDLGLSKDVVGAVRASVGTIATVVGIAAGGLAAVRFGYLWTLIAGVIMKSSVIAAFAALAWLGPDVRLFSVVMFADNFGIGFAGVALVTYMSTLTSVGYTATQYALLSSTYTYIGKFAKGFSGVMVEHLAAGRSLLDGYALFFIVSGLLGLPALILCGVLARATKRAAAQ
ncbi:MAG TPA: MFS transporter [Vicinamibacterales bacterium]|jgi:PAT family beta-lactamase induction signal transducer AmpG|nr:MFS transporter [Vicinamibacterales bacterium]